MALLAGTWLACGGKVDGPIEAAGSEADAPTGSQSSPAPSGTHPSGYATTDCIAGRRPECDRGDIERATRDEACTGEPGVRYYSRVGCHWPEIWCQDLEFGTCAGATKCGVGLTEVKNCTSALTCMRKTTCGFTIYCEKVEPDCDAPPPVCTRGKRIAGSYACWADRDCWTESNACGQTVWCQEQS